jgi:hypothetical protein
MMTWGCKGEMSFSGGVLSYTDKGQFSKTLVCNGSEYVELLRLKGVLVNTPIRFPYGKTRFTDRQIRYGDCDAGTYGYVGMPEEIQGIKKVLDNISCDSLEWLGKGELISNTRVDLGILFCKSHSEAYQINIVGSCN